MTVICLKYLEFFFKEKGYKNNNMCGHFLISVVYVT